MFFILKCLLFVFLLPTLLLSHNSHFTQEEQNWIKKNPNITIGMLNDYVPFSFIQKKTHQGFSVDILEDISKISGLKFTVQTGNWMTILGNFQTGKLDMISDISYTKEREAFTIFTTPFYEIPTFIFGFKNDINYKDNKSLIGKKVAITKNIFYKNEIQKLGMILIECETSLDKVQALKQGKADYFIDPYIVGKQSLKTYGVDNIRVLDEFKAIKREDLRFGINKDKPILHSIIQKSYGTLSSNHLINLSNKWMMNSDNMEKQNIVSFTKEEQEYLDTKPIITYSEVDWEPLSIIENNRMKGIMGDFLDLVAKKTGIEFAFKESKSWPDVLEKFAKKEIDLVPGVGSSDEERKLGAMSDMYATYPMVIVTRDNYKFVENLSTFNGKIVAIPKYYTSYNFVKQSYPNIKILATKNIEEALLKVNSGEAEAFVGHIATSIFYLSKLYLKDLKISGTANFVFEHHYLIQKENPLLLSIINKTFASITEEEKQQIYKKWVQTTVVKETVPYNLMWKIFAGVLFFFAIMLYFQKKLKQEVALKTEELKKLNESLENKVLDEVEKNIEIQERLFKADKLASLGEMIGNIAHQWRQPLSVISTASTGLMLQKEYENLTDERFYKLCNSINDNAQYLSKTIDDFQNFIKGDRVEVTFDLTFTIESFLSLVDGSAKTHNIQLVLDLDRKITLLGYPNELIQCFMNIYSNAKDALKEVSNERYLFISTKIYEGDCLITFKDNGGGIFDEVLPKIFEPYFTTKHKSRGTGLGLHMTYNLIVNGMDGKIEATNSYYSHNGNEYKGAVFQILLPIKLKT